MQLLATVTSILLVVQAVHVPSHLSQLIAQFMVRLWVVCFLIFLKNKYAFKAQKQRLNYSIIIENENGQKIAQIERKLMPKKLKVCFVVIEKDHDNLIFEDRNFIYTLAFASKDLFRK